MGCHAKTPVLLIRRGEYDSFLAMIAPTSAAIEGGRLLRNREEGQGVLGGQSCCTLIILYWRFFQPRSVRNGLLPQDALHGGIPEGRRCLDIDTATSLSCRSRRVLQVTVRLSTNSSTVPQIGGLCAATCWDLLDRSAAGQCRALSPFSSLSRYEYRLVLHHTLLLSCHSDRGRVFDQVESSEGPIERAEQHAMVSNGRNVLWDPSLRPPLHLEHTGYVRLNFGCMGQPDHLQLISRPWLVASRLNCNPDIIL